MPPLQVINHLAPGGFADILDQWPVLLGGEVGDGFTLQSPTHHLFPGGDMERDFPDIMGIGERPGRSLGGSDIGQQLSHGRTMPGVALECSSQLIFDTLNLAHNPSSSPEIIGLAMDATCTC